MLITILAIVITIAICVITYLFIRELLDHLNTPKLVAATIQAVWPL